MTDRIIHFDSLIEYCPQAFVFADMQGTILLANPSAYKMYGYSGNELINQNVDIFNSKQTINTDEIVEDITNLGIWSGELIQRKKNNTNFYAELTVTLVFKDGAPIGLSSYSRDITAKIEADKLLAEQSVMLTASSKLSAIGEMAGGIAHEINNPLSIINAKAYRLKKKLSDESFTKEMILT